MAKYMVKIGGAIGDIGEVKFGFYAPDDAYDDIGDELGVRKLAGENAPNESDLRGIAFGINSPRPPRVRISYLDRDAGGGSRNDNIRSTIRYCDPDKVGRVLNGSIRDKKVTVSGTPYDVQNVSMAS